jgi:hypothetical protein
MITTHRARNEVDIRRPLESMIVHRDIDLRLCPNQTLVLIQEPVLRALGWIEWLGLRTAGFGAGVLDQPLAVRLVWF